MLTKEERRRKIELRHRLFEPRTIAEREQNIHNFATAEEVGVFLALAGKDHRKYFHYTHLDALLSMLKSGRFNLTRADRLNDLKEFGRLALRSTSYVASFGSSALENVAMWWMYGLNGKEDDEARIPIRLEFSGKALQQLTAKLACSVAQDKCGVGPVLRSDGSRVSSVRSVSLHDMLYQRAVAGGTGKVGKHWNGAVSWNGLVANDTRCRAFENACEALPGLVKDAGWSYENETRLTIRLPPEDASVSESISIPFATVLRTVRIVVGPGRGSEKQYSDAIGRIANAMKTKELEGVSDWAARIQPSQYKIKFTTGKTKRKTKRHAS